MRAKLLVALVAVGLLTAASSFSSPSKELATREREIADLEAQLGRLQTDAGYWRQLTALLAPVEMPLMTDHRAYMLPGGLVVALHFDDMDLEAATNLNWLAIGIPGTYWKSDQERVEAQFGKGFVHFHDMKNDIHGGEPGAEGVWFVHIAVREFGAPWGPVKPGVDHNFMITPAPERPKVSAAR